MRNEVIAKVNKMGKIGQIVTNVGKGLLIAALIIGVIAVGVCVCLPKEAVSVTLSGEAVVKVNEEAISMAGLFGDIAELEEAEGNLDVNGFKYEVVSVETNGGMKEALAETETHTFYLKDLSGALAVFFLYIGATAVVLHFIGALCKNFRNCETPFNVGAVQTLKKLAYSLIPMAILSSMGESLADSVLTGQMDISIGVDIMVVVVIVLIFLLAAIFNYGTMLQQESDELL